MKSVEARKLKETGRKLIEIDIKVIEISRNMTKKTGNFIEIR